MYFKPILLLAGLYIILAACSTRSKVEKIFVDSAMVKDIESRYDLKAVNPMDSGLEQTTYITKTKDMNVIVRDSLNHIRAIDYINANRDSLKFNYYANGQSEYKRILRVKPGIDSGVLFYEDGRINATGLSKDSNNIGEWRFYDLRGYLRWIYVYDDNGKKICEIDVDKLK